MAKKKAGKNKGFGAKTAPSKAKTTSIADSINTEIIAQALSSVNQSVLLKLCRLCEAKDGPFLNIFEADKVIAKKIDDLMPFGIEENDDLPHKICFRCSAKVEELYEFVQKCIRTQNSLRKALGKNGSLVTRPKTRTLWEEKLNKSNMSNDDICDALIKKAMEGIKDIPPHALPLEEDDLPLSKREIQTETPLEKPEVIDTKKDNAAKKNQSKPDVEVAGQRLPSTRASRSTLAEPLLEGLPIAITKGKKSKTADNDTSLEKSDKDTKRTKPTAPLKEAESESQIKTNTASQDAQEDKKPFNIMDHISMIKVNGVGVLFQCKLCNRNFLKKDVVMSHSCAKNGGIKREVIPDYLPPDPPKKSVVKYINTNIKSNNPPSIVNEKPIVLDDTPSVPIKTKPKAGPASKVKRIDLSSDVIATSSKTGLSANTSQAPTPTVQFPAVPCVNSRYKLVPGPNNTFTLVEEKTDKPEVIDVEQSSEGTSGSKKNKSNVAAAKTKDIQGPKLAQTLSGLPYPVGLIKKVAHDSNEFAQPEPVSFTTPAMKKQSYTVVQTGNPSKLLISTKPQGTPEEIPKKRTKRTRYETKGDSDQPFSVTLEDATPPKDSGFFTFINVDPLLQPSYVLPTDNIIQESQISTSTQVSNQNNQIADKDKEKDKDKYSCNMCDEKFTREKKLLAHIHSHYNKMDEEDMQREKSRKRARKPC